MNKSKLSILAALFLNAFASHATLSEGEYYIYNDFFEKLLTDNNGPRLGKYDADNDANYIFVAEQASGDYVKLRHKLSGKYLTASTSNTWSILLTEGNGQGDEYLWQLDQQFSTSIVSKRNTSKRIGCDFSSGSTYYWNEDYVPVYYDKGVGTMTWFSIIPSTGDGFESSRNATTTSPFTNEYGVREQDAYCVSQAITVSGLDYHILSSTPFADGGSVNLEGTDSWLIFDNVRPSAVSANYLDKVRINGMPAVAGQNCRVEIYIKGAAVIPTAEYAFMGNTDSSSYTLGTGNHTELGTESNKTRSFTLKRGYMATLYSGENNTGYSRVYVADHADLTIELPKALDQRLSSVYIRNWHYTSKSGYAKTGGDATYATTRCGASWYWNWDANSSSSADAEYIPIKQHLYWPSDGNFYKSGSTAMMLFNEPEHSEQHTSSTCSCGGTIDAWKAYQNTSKFNDTGLRIGSPSATDLSYIKQYDDYCHNNAQRLDFNCTHGYWTTEWANNLNTLKSYGRPVWITEWEYGASWTSGSNPKSADDARAKVLDILERLEYNDYVERYAYYEFDTGGSNGWMRELFWEQDASKGLAYVGQIYDRVKHHLGYNASIQPVPNWWTPSVATPAIQKVYLSDGRYTLLLSNANGDATASINIQKYDGSSWQTIASLSDRALFESTSLGIDIDSGLLTESCSLRAVITTLYSSTETTSAEYAFEATNTEGHPLDQLQNLSFDEASFVSANVITYAKDKQGNDLSGEQPVEGWTANDPNADAHASASIEWGAENSVGGSTPPAVNSAKTTSGGALAIVGCWSSTTHYSQSVTFPAGTYTLTIPVYNAMGTKEFNKNLIGFIADNGTEYLATTRSYPIGWTTETITFTLNGMTSGRLSLGYEAANTGSGNMPHLFIDYISISDGTDTWPKIEAEPVYYTITFVDAEGAEISSGQYIEGAEIDIPDAPEREGHTFAGWNTEVTTATADATYTALYTVNTYSLTYILDGEEYQTFTLDYGTPITPLEAPAKEGYSFDGWSDIPSTMPANDVTVTGSFTYVVPDGITHLFAGAKPTAIFTPEGQRISTLRKGLNIVVLSDSSIRKIFIK